MERRYRRRDAQEADDAPPPPKEVGAPTTPQAAAPAAPPARAAAGQERVPFPLQAQERILQISRRHWFFLWPRSIMLLIYALAPPIIIGVVLDWIGAYEDVVAQVFWIAAALWILFWGIQVFLNWYRYHNDMWVITNQRIVDVYRKHPPHKRIASADLVNIQDMTVERHGLFATALGFGDVVCQTAGAQGTFVLSGIPKPDEVQLLVDRERDRERMRRE